MFKDRPTPGYQYKVKANDGLGHIETLAYGRFTYTLEQANPYLLKRKHIDGWPYIYVGDIINIPELQELRNIQQYKPSKKNKNDLTIVIGDREIIPTNARVFLSIETAADGFTASIPWVLGDDQELDKLLQPYTYPKVQVFIGDELLLTGSLYGVSPSIDSNGSQIDLEGFSYAADAVDSTVPGSFEENNVTLKQRADKMLAPIGIKCEFEFDAGGSFDKITADRNDKIFDHLQGLAAQRGGLLTSLPNGNINFTRAKTGSPVGVLEIGDGILLDISAKYDGRGMFNQITAYGESPGSPTKNASVIDGSIPKSRFFAFAADDTTDGDIQKAAEWKRSQIYAAALENNINVVGWYAPNNKLWQTNTLLTIKSPVIFAGNGFTYLIKSVEYLFESGGMTTSLSIVPPSVYTGEEITLPWSDNL